MWVIYVAQFDVLFFSIESTPSGNLISLHASSSIQETLADTRKSSLIIQDRFEAHGLLFEETLEYYYGFQGHTYYIVWKKWLR